MSQRNSGRVRMPRDAYQTPAEVTEALMLYLRRERLLPTSPNIWEPACGHGKMAAVLAKYGRVFASDIDPTAVADDAFDFLSTSSRGRYKYDAIITNPPYGDLAEPFVRHALAHAIDLPLSIVAMLLPNNWGTAKGRSDLMDCNGAGAFTPSSSCAGAFDGSKARPDRRRKTTPGSFGNRAGVDTRASPGPIVQVSPRSNARMRSGHPKRHKRVATATPTHREICGYERQTHNAHPLQGLWRCHSVAMVRRFPDVQMRCDPYRRGAHDNAHALA